MAGNTLYEDLQALQKTQSETLVRDLEIELLEPEVKQGQSGRDITYLNWRYRDPSVEKSEWTSRSTPIFADEAKVLLSQGPYEQGQLYRVTAQKGHDGYWKWSGIGNAGLQPQREQHMQTMSDQRQVQSQQHGHEPQQAPVMSQGYEPQH